MKKQSTNVNTTHHGAGFGNHNVQKKHASLQAWSSVQYTPYQPYVPTTSAVTRPGADDHKKYGSLQADGTIKPYARHRLHGPSGGMNRPTPVNHGSTKRGTDRAGRFAA